MRKLTVIFIICATMLYGILLCYAGELDGIQKDFPLSMKYETKQALENAAAFTAEAKIMLAEQQVSLDVLGSLCYLGYVYSGSFDGEVLGDVLEWNKSFPLNAPIYKSEIYKGYYKLRTENFIKQYGTAGVFNYEAFIKSTRAEFDAYINSAVKDETLKKNTIVLLQEKLMDKLVELAPDKRKTALNEIFSLRQPSNKDLYQNYLYEVFEYGVRLQFLNERLESNREDLIKLSNNAALSITADKGGKLLIQYADTKNKPETLEVLNIQKDEQGYGGLTVLGELYGKKNSRLVFIDTGAHEHLIEMNRVWNAISLNEKGYLQLQLDDLMEQGKTDTANGNEQAEANELDPKLLEEKIKALEAYHNSKASEAQAIMRELNRYSMYLELKDKGISNNFTKKFEADKKAWKTALDAKLNRFGSGGMADFAAYIKLFELADKNEVSKSARGRILIASFRNSVVQYRQPDDSSVWITDMLFNFKNLK